MSLSAAHESKVLRKHCQSCHARKARFQYRGRVRADRDHTLCFECYRSERERGRANAVATAGRPTRLYSPLIGPPSLSQRETAHRRAMLAHLQRSVVGACRGVDS